MPLLRPGIAGFNTETVVAFREFKRAVYDAAYLTNAAVIATAAADGVTPNFHQADINIQDRELSILCNGNFPLVAFFERPILNSCLKPIDEPSFAKAMCESGFELASVAELQSQVELKDLALLSEAERKQAQYWKPKCVADILFNWWD